MRNTLKDEKVFVRIINEQLVALSLFGLVLLTICPTFAAESVFNSKFGTEVMPAERFSGKAAHTYGLAKEIPEVCSKLFCYCGCDYSDDHSSLLDCFTTIHGDSCPICQEEVEAAYKLKKQGKDLLAIQDAIDSMFSDQYPFKSASPAYYNYRKSRGLPDISSEAGPKSIVPNLNNSGEPELKDDFAHSKKHKPIKCCKHEQNKQ
jgi:Protein of unknown function with PCYCGC motif